jgi:hypothetical protein
MRSDAPSNIYQRRLLPHGEAIYRQVLQTDLCGPSASHFIAVIAYQVGKNDLAVELICLVIAVNQTSQILTITGVTRSRCSGGLKRQPPPFTGH